MAIPLLNYRAYYGVINALPSIIEGHFNMFHFLKCLASEGFPYCARYEQLSASESNFLSYRCKHYYLYFKHDDDRIYFYKKVKAAEVCNTLTKLL